MAEPSQRGRLRARRDLRVTPSGEGWVVKDPLSLEYFRLGERERYLLEELRTPLDLVELTRRFRARFPNERIDEAGVLGFCAALRECSLLVSDRVAERPRGWGWLNALASPLAIRLPGFDPTRVLAATDWVGRALLSRWGAALGAVAATLVGVGLLGDLERLLADFGRLAYLAEPRHAVAAVLAVALTKSWHELGHALACRRMGAECPEVGVMLLALAPCLYCDASDAWALPDRWRRAVVGLAGVYFEGLLAVAAAALWLVLQPGPLATLAVWVVLAASVSTLAINLNPLLKLDGYYVLADTWGVPNLREQSGRALWGGLGRWVRGSRGPAEGFDASPGLLAAYAAASMLYGFAVLAIVLFAIHAGLDAVGLRAVGDVIVAASIAGLLAAGLRGLLRLAPRGPGALRGGAIVRGGVVVAIAAAALFGIATIQVEQSLRAPCRIEATPQADVVAPIDGIVRPRVALGDTVGAGDLLAELESPGADLRLLELRGEEAGLRAEIAGLETRAQRDPSLLAEAARLRPALAQTRGQIVGAEADASARRLRAPMAGRVVAAALRPDESPFAAETAGPTAWSGAPLDPPNRGCALAAGETLCRVAGEGRLAVLMLDEHDSALVRLGDRVRVALDRRPDRWIDGRVESVAAGAADGGLAAGERALEEALADPLARGARFRIEATLDGFGPECQPGALGAARVVTGSETIGDWLLRRLRRLFRFR